MATVSDDLIKEGEGLLFSKNAEEILKFSDRVISVEPDNWYGLYVRGCGYALEPDFANCISNWRSFLDNVEDDSVVERYVPEMCGFLTHCLMHISGKPNLDFSKMGEMLTVINDRLPESEDEVFVTKCMELGLKYLKDNSACESLLTYYSYKALVFCSFRSYVELPILSGFFDGLAAIGDEIKAREDPRIGNVIDADRIFLNEVKAALDSAVENCPPETMERIEEYWLEHNVETYVSHIQQAYNASAAAATAGKLTGKLARKIMLTETQNFIRVYLGPKI